MEKTKRNSNPENLLEKFNEYGRIA